MRVSVSTGPGSHSHHLVTVLTRGGVLARVTYHWPRFEVWEWRGARLERLTGLAWHDRLVWLTWAGWRRLPGLRRYETPRAPLSALFDLLARHYLTPTDLFVGWSQTSLRTLHRGKRLGAVTVLEHPATHVDTWARLVREEYARWGQGAQGHHSLFPGLLRRRMRREYAEADFISVLSSFAKRTFLEAGVAPAKLVQLPLGVDTERFRPGPRREGPPRILCVGRLELLKGVQYLLQAFSQLRRPEAELWFVGPVLPEVQLLLQRYTHPRIRVVGEVGHEQLPAYYRDADVLVFPSINDAFGLVILEAMASGLPVITTEHSAGRDLIEDRRHGFVVPIRDAEALADRLRYLFDHRDAAQAMGSAGRDRAQREFTWAHYGERLLATYRALLGTQAPTRRETP